MSDTLKEIVQWFEIAMPEPDFNDYITQLGCHLEEVCEMMAAIGGIDEDIYISLKDRAEFIKSLDVPDEYIETQKAFIDKLGLLDSLCNQIVTAMGVGYMMGFDMQGALSEVSRSNMSKFEDGKPVFFDNGKIAKGKDYSEPDLSKFLGGRND